jgi:hypothetical protein
MFDLPTVELLRVSHLKDVFMKDWIPWQVYFGSCQKEIWHDPHCWSWCSSFGKTYPVTVWPVRCWTSESFARSDVITDARSRDRSPVRGPGPKVCEPIDVFMIHDQGTNTRHCIVPSTTSSESNDRTCKVDAQLMNDIARSATPRRTSGDNQLHLALTTLKSLMWLLHLVSLKRQRCLGTHVLDQSSWKISVRWDSPNPGRTYVAQRFASDPSNSALFRLIIPIYRDKAGLLSQAVHIYTYTFVLSEAVHIYLDMRECSTTERNHYDRCEMICNVTIISFVESKLTWRKNENQYFSIRICLNSAGANWS